MSASSVMSMWILATPFTLPRDCQPLVMENPINYLAYRREQNGCAVLEFEADNYQAAQNFVVALGNVRPKNIPKALRDPIQQVKETP